ncbi:hypothetical protein H257_00741 [Aphanomyces astaci]|uniref:Uncharacterized protein n=1 Tax=Aphanomyces astaci TaxID=112090 RepID=W4HD09_APHAT|nr:hypothetical protein H257_00741 [Aphanomyces astaci]ETV89471.1 hypothetical protein H257_00741 [Aphanomyces astaci]|eukprot:XP_009821871.1 hypothetical protein H257_00741 [Aphanomyces astaci]
MHHVEAEYAQDDIAIDLSFENAEFVNEDGDDESTDDKLHVLPQSKSLAMKNALQELKKEFTTPSLTSEALASVDVISEYLEQLEGQVQDLTVKQAMHTIDMHNMRQLYRASVEENEKLATTTSLPTTSAPTELSDAMDTTTSQLREYMELDMEVHQAKQDRDKFRTQNERVVALCAQFQQEIMWRNIDVAEGEKRCLAMSRQLEGTRQLYEESQRENAELKGRVEAMAQHIQTLVQHKKVLVHEVKSLQKYSHVNITGLEQDAQEARMMQKSLTMQLESAHAERDELKAKLNAHNITTV